METYELIIRLALACLLGSIIGFERQRREWTAGLRTHMLVCVGSALIMIVSAYGFNDVLHKPGIVLDPSRVAAQVVSGIGFLGAGTILFTRNEIVRGLTTAAGLWTVAAIGLAVGGGLYMAASITTLMAFIILALIKPLEEKVFNKNKFNGLKLTVKRNQINLEEIQRILVKHNVLIKEVRIAPAFSDNGDNDEVNISIQKLAARNKNILAILDEVRKIEAVNTVDFFTV
jgi:putative Mg2+ transporter-C (MgtC) family protein